MSVCRKIYCGNEASTLPGLCDGHDLLRLEFSWQNRLFNWSIKTVAVLFNGEPLQRFTRGDGVKINIDVIVPLSQINLTGTVGA